MRLAELGHEAADKHLFGACLTDRLRYAWHQEIGQDTRIEISGTEDDEVGGGNGQQHTRDGRAIGGIEPNLFDVQMGIILGNIDAVLTTDNRPVFQAGAELNVRLSHRKHHFAHVQQVAQCQYSLQRAPFELIQGGEDDVAYGVLPQVSSARETVQEELPQIFGRIGEADDAAQDVSPWMDAELIA